MKTLALGLLIAFSAFEQKIEMESDSTRTEMEWRWYLRMGRLAAS
jgi:hypothetical protein